MNLKSILGACTSVALCTSQLAYATLPASYEYLRAVDKQYYLWEEIKNSDYMKKSDFTHLPSTDPGIISGILRLFSSSFLWTTFTHVSDEMPEGRLKLIHTYGSVAEVEFKMNSDSRYSGLFKTGGVGLARLSLAKQSGGFTPGMGLKLLIDEQHPSVNFQVMYSLDGQGNNRNIFENEFKNVIDPPSSFILKGLGQAFELAIRCLPGRTESGKPLNATTLPLLEAAQINADGTQVASESVNEPFIVIFTPTDEVKKLFSSKVDKDFRLGLAEIPPGMTLYTVSVKKDRESAAEVIGSLTTTSTFIASEYGDQKLFFQHMSHRNIK